VLDGLSHEFEDLRSAVLTIGHGLCAAESRVRGGSTGTGERRRIARVSAS